MDTPDPVPVARELNRAGISAAPLAGLSAISLFDDDEYENYQVDLVGPRRRLAVARRLAEVGFRQLSGRTFEAPGGRPRVVFPRPGSLWSEPLKGIRDLLGEPETIVLLTPTQALLLLLERAADREEADPDPDPAASLAALVHEQPANLDKVAQWTRRSAAGRLFRSLRSSLEERQAAGVRARRERSFRSRLPT